MLQGKWLLKHRFVHEEIKWNQETHHKNKTNSKTPGIQFVQIRKALETLFIYRSDDSVKKLVMISIISHPHQPPPRTISLNRSDTKTEVSWYFRDMNFNTLNFEHERLIYLLTWPCDTDTTFSTWSGRWTKRFYSSKQHQPILRSYRCEAEPSRLPPLHKRLSYNALDMTHDRRLTGRGSSHAHCHFNTRGLRFRVTANDRTCSLTRVGRLN